jgi:hypothetical protein
VKLEVYLEKCRNGMDEILERVDNGIAPIRCDDDVRIDIEEDHRPGITIQEMIDLQSLHYAYFLEKPHESLFRDIRNCIQAKKYLRVLVPDFDWEHPFELDEDGRPDLSKIFKKYNL